jgi:hypothetical protein
MQKSEEFDVVGLGSRIQDWALDEYEKRAAVAVFRDKTKERSVIHMAGTTEDIGKCVYDLMRRDREVGMAIYMVASTFAQRHFTQDFIRNVNGYAKAVIELRDAGLGSENFDDKAGEVVDKGVELMKTTDEMINNESEVNNGREEKSNVVSGKGDAAGKESSTPNENVKAANESGYAGITAEEFKAAKETLEDLLKD